MHIWALFFLLSFQQNRLPEPHIVTQHTEKNGSMTLYIHNPLDKAVWAWLECKNVVSVQPIGLPARKFSEVNLKSNDPNVAVDDNTCFVMKWQFQGNGNIP